MPSAPRPKTFTARKDFSTGGVHFEKGDAVPPGLALDTALRFGSTFVESHRGTTPDPVDSGTNPDTSEE